MLKKITGINQKVRSKEFSGKYPRLSRENTELSPDNAPKEMLAYSPESWNIPDYVYATTKNEPIDGFYLLRNNKLLDILPCFNDVLIYRMVKGLYGEPDLLGGYISHLEGKPPFPGTLDWSFTLEIQKDLFAEIRSVLFTRTTHLKFWYTSQPRDIKEKETVNKLIEQFINDFKKAVESNLHLFDERTDIERAKKCLLSYLSHAFSNIYIEKYKGAKKLLELADLFDQQPEKLAFNHPDPKQRFPKPGESFPVYSTGYMYLSSAMLFIVALESLINTFYMLLLRSDFAHERYERITIRSDLDLRILSIHLFCKGFISQPIAPGSNLWNRLLKLRDFRNDVFHGNLTEEYRTYIIPEDCFMFHYSPAKDFRGRQKSNISDGYLSRDMSNIGKSTVESIKNLSDEIKDAIIAAMDVDTQRWVNSWISEPIIKPLLKDKNQTR